MPGGYWPAARAPVPGRPRERRAQLSLVAREMLARRRRVHVATVLPTELTSMFFRLRSQARLYACAQLQNSLAMARWCRPVTPVGTGRGC